MRKLIAWLQAPVKRIELARNTLCLVAGLLAIAAIAQQGTPPGGYNLAGGAGGVANGSNISVNGQFNVKNSFGGVAGAIGDAKFSRTVVVTTASQTVTDATDAPWTAADKGKLISCVNTGIGALTVGISTITAVASSSSITVSSAGVGGVSGNSICVWATQDDTAAFLSAINAAKPVIVSFDPVSGPTFSSPGVVVIPPGGYLISGPIYSINNGTSALAPNVIGSGRQTTFLYLASSFTPLNGATWPGGLISIVSAKGVEIDGFTVDGLELLAANFTGGQDLINIQAVKILSRGLEVQDWGGSQGGNAAAVAFKSASFGTIEELFVQNSPGSDGTLACKFDTDAGLMVNNMVCSNHFQNLGIFSSGGRTPTSSPLTFNNGFIDECGVSGANGCTFLQGVNSINFNGTQFYASGTNNCAISLDTTSVGYFNQTNAGAFNTVNNVSALCLAGNAKAFSSQSHWRGNGSIAAITGPLTATYNDEGGNVIQNCTSTTCNNVTPAQIGTLGFTGGIVPNTSLTHTYPEPFLPALPASGTAQTIVAFTPAQNILVRSLTITASNTPTCATPPTFQVSNGSISFTQTFASAAQISGPTTPTVANATFIAGTQVTLSITNAAYACATAPVNMNFALEYEVVLSP